MENKFNLLFLIYNISIIFRVLLQSSLNVHTELVGEKK
jgi:hypothetical protein